ncbi:hypothetical protein FISHEDRAFT_64161 [Fistulina hepatica ATCC 64428]|uniref:Uncharacterized protein n=1 Tax=Fistulina hepatica ATCC 64428 TaxID=1128425 RepID=A0A0D7AIF1_9AGAR|nr:hypothetical protein FISHEDRAFT_64161 [Fistulina hepatica ATCC 64428]
MESQLNKHDSIPDYVLTYAPYTHLWSEEEWWPNDIVDHLEHVTPKVYHPFASYIGCICVILIVSLWVDYVAVADSVTIETLDTFSTDTYLTSDDNVEDNPAWLLAAENEPDSSGLSFAPATIICVEKDVENMNIRIQFFGSPEYIFLSAHSDGDAYTYDALTSTDNRATVYIAGGDHANYPTTGKQDYIAWPLGTLSDTTDDGPYWDVTQNYRGYWYDNDTDTYTSAGGTDTGGTERESESVDWLYWLGYWGDEQYPTSDPRQNYDFGCLYTSLSLGPLAKNLGRTQVCLKSDCTIRTSI